KRKRAYIADTLSFLHIASIFVPNSNRNKDICSYFFHPKMCAIFPRKVDDCDLCEKRITQESGKGVAFYIERISDFGRKNYERRT
ncbi:MAG: hypothetical protein ACI4OL_02515, partial [Gemmiger sp.]